MNALKQAASSLAATSLVALGLHLAAPAPALAQAAAASGRAEREAVLGVVKALFDGMRAHDSTAIRGTLHPEARLLTTTTKDGEPVVEVEAIDGFLGAVAGSGSSLDERTHDPEVRIDAGLASVWTEYDFYLDGKLSHCGVDAFQLGKTAGGWKILQIVDTRRKEGCPGR